MKNKTVLMVVCTLLLANILLVQVANAKPAYCDKAMSECRSSCGSMSLLLSGAGAIIGQSWLSVSFGVGCWVGCRIGYEGCGG